ncbi:DUF6344 domain-containing protein [Streptomyces sp. NPDC026672]|uniref:DUF6344 domain-containing protein n=1 Tax=unclassified Streptomyces TaxID=2593676 RepID=UPI0033C32C23
MARNKVMKLWTAFVTAFLALCTALGLVTTTATTAAAAATPQNETETEAVSVPAAPAAPATPPHWSWTAARALPPTMKQRIRAEAHGKTPSCRHRPLNDTEQDTSPESAALLNC